MYNKCTKDSKLKVIGVETMQKSPDIHYVLDIVEDFSIKNKLKINFDKKDKEIVFLLIKSRFEDSFLQSKVSILIDNNEITVNESLFKKKSKILIDLIDKKETIVFNFFNEKDWSYCKSILMFVEDSNHDENFYFLKELSRWNKD